MVRKQKQKQKQSQSVRVVVNVGKRSGGKGKTQKKSAPAPPPMTGMMLNRILPPIPLAQAPPPAPDFTAMLMATLAGITGTQKKDTVGPAPVSKEEMKAEEAEQQRVMRALGALTERERRFVLEHRIERGKQAEEIRQRQKQVQESQEQGQGPAQPAISSDQPERMKMRRPYYQPKGPGSELIPVGSK